MAGRDVLREQQRQHRAKQRHSRNGGDPLKDYEVTFDAKGKLVLPDDPKHDDHAGLCAWSTVVLHLDRHHPITRGIRGGSRSEDGHVLLCRAGAHGIRFEPASHITSPTKLIDTLAWQQLPTDGVPYAYNQNHCRHIAHVIKMLCGLYERESADEETKAIIGLFMFHAEPVEGLTTYGTGAQSYEAAVALRGDKDEFGRLVGTPHYLIESPLADSGGEVIRGEQIVIEVTGLQRAARDFMGTSLPRGWLNARMDMLGWERIRLDGHALAGRAGRHGPHARIDAYRGPRPSSVEQESVTT